VEKRVRWCWIGEKFSVIVPPRPHRTQRYRRPKRSRVLIVVLHAMPRTVSVSCRFCVFLHCRNMRQRIVPIAIALLLVVVMTAMTSPTPIAATPKDESPPSIDASAAHAQTFDINSSATAAAADETKSSATASSSSLPSKDVAKSAIAKLLTKSSSPTRTLRKARTVMSSYNYPVVRNGRCATNLEYYGHCYLCGRMADVPRIYYECCLENDNVRTFCEAMLT
jgi:hypothetical protein